LPVDYQELEARIGYQFRNPELLKLALTHRSFAYERPEQMPEIKNNLIPGNYERLEFLGDAVVDLVIGHLLMQSFPQALEGELSKRRASLVNIKQLSRLAKKLGLDEWIRLGKGEEASGGRNKPSILSDSYEAICAAVYLDGGFERVFSMIQTHFQEMFSRVNLSQMEQDYKTRLQELIQAQNRRTPRYRMVAESGPDHSKSFEVEVIINQQAVARGIGKSKKDAEQDAAQKALAILENPGKINNND